MMRRFTSAPNPSERVAMYMALVSAALTRAPKRTPSKRARLLDASAGATR